MQTPGLLVSGAGVSKDTVRRTVGYAKAAEARGFHSCGSPSFRLILVVRNSRTYHVVGSSPRILYAPYRLHLK